MSAEHNEVERQMEQFRAVAQDAGVKLTHQRLEIFREIAARRDHPDAEAVYRAVRRRVPTVSLDTVYRTLWMLHDLGLITTLGPRQRDSMRFDANLAPHHHYVCVRCGSTWDFESEAFNALQVPKAVQAFGAVLGAQVEIRGICSACAKIKAESSASHIPQPPEGRKRRST